MIQELREIFIVWIIEVIRQEYAVLLGGDDQLVIFKILIEAQDKSVRSAAEKEPIPGKLKGPNPDGDPVAAK